MSKSIRQLLTPETLNQVQEIVKDDLEGATRMVGDSIGGIVDKADKNDEQMKEVIVDFLKVRAHIIAKIQEDHEQNGNQEGNFSMREQYPADEEHMISDFPIAMVNLLEQDKEIGKVSPSEIKVMLIAALMHDYDRTSRETAVFRKKGMTREEQKEEHVLVSLEKSLLSLEELGVKFTKEELELYKELILNHHKNSEGIDSRKAKMFADIENLTFFGAIAKDYIKPERHTSEASLLQLVTKYEALPDNMKKVADKLIGKKGDVRELLEEGLNIKNNSPEKWEELKEIIKNQKNVKTPTK